MFKEDKETQTPEPEEDKTSKNKTEEEPETPEEEKKETSEPKEEKTSEEIKSLQAQKEHWREKAQKAEEEAKRLREKESSAPSDEELARKYPDWEYKEEDEKKRIKAEEQREKRLRRLEEELAWQKDYTKTLRDFPQLSSKEGEFKEFAYDHPETKDLEMLAESFLFRNKELLEKKEPEEPPKRKGLEKPTGGGTAPSPEMTGEDIKRLRETDYPRYVKLLKKGKIKI